MSSSRIVVLKMKMREIKMQITTRKTFSIRKIFIYIDQSFTFMLENMKKQFKI
jgi:hypothetical protein